MMLWHRISMGFVAGLLVVACGDDGSTGGSGEGDGTETDTETESDTNTTTMSASSTTAGDACEGVNCSGQGQCFLDPDSGGAVCVCDDGWENDPDDPLQCVMGGTSTTDPSTTGVDTTASTGDTGDTTASTGDTGDTGDTGGVACEDVEKITLDGSMATLSGDWVNIQSMIGEGEIAVLMGGVDGSVLWQPEIPCEDTWHIWVRYWEDGPDDSYYATLDGMPMPPAIYEGDCTFMGQSYGWTELNWRDEANQGPCEYTEDPWTADWGAGTHDVEFSYREVGVIARIIVINDPMFVPGPMD